MAIPQYKIFFDTSAYIAALISPKGAAGELLRLVEVGILQMVVSQEVVVEIDRVVMDKFPELIQENRKLLKHLAPQMAPNPTKKQAKLFLERLPQADATILCSAHLEKVAAFITWNTRDFMGGHISSLVDFPIVVPADALKLFRKWLEPFLE
jgi:predicted nucleic acid-binding protein